jgi:hypothetical protein
LDKEINPKKCISSLGLCLRRFSKEKIPCIEEKDFSPFFFYLGNESRFLGNTTKRVPKSPARFNLPHDVIGVNHAE